MFNMILWNTIGDDFEELEAFTIPEFTIFLYEYINKVY